MSHRLTYLLILAAVALTGCGKGASLTCNFSKADISTLENEHTVLAGFAARKGLSTDIHERIWSNCLVLADGTDKVCIISNDVMEMSPALSDSIRVEISARSGLPKESILMHNIHTHSSPRFGGSSVVPGGANYSYFKRVPGIIIENAVRTILDSTAFQPFRLKIGKGATEINANRCEKEGPVDPEVYVARFETLKGKPIVSILNLACHPVCMGPGSHQISPDYVGVARRYLQEVWGGEIVQFTGASGNMDPVKGPGKVDRAEAYGKALADSLAGIAFQPVNPRAMRLAHTVALLPYKVEHITPEAVKAHADSIVKWGVTVSPTWAEDVRGWETQILSRFEQGPIPEKLAFNLHALALGDVIFFFTQGEPFVEYQLETRAAFPGKTLFFAGYTNGQNSYLPSARAFAVRKGYEYEIDQMHVYIKAPYPLSETMPDIYTTAIRETIRKVIDTE